MKADIEGLCGEMWSKAPHRIPGMVSVIMPAFNCAGFVAESIGSVIAQTYRSWELLVVDDASSDNTPLVARSIAAKEPRVRVMSLAENGGVANARNVGMENACGQYLAFLDSDDLWLPKKLEAQTEFMRDHQIGFSFSRYRRIEPDGCVGRVIRIPSRVEYDDLLKGNLIGCLTVMIDCDKVGPFNMPPIRHEDYAAWLSILKKGHVAYGLQEDLARYRVCSSSLTGNKLRSAAWTWRIYRQREQLSFLKALWCFAFYTARSIGSRSFGEGMRAKPAPRSQPGVRIEKLTHLSESDPE
jgi:teichuronic acid biosynthesis glycosyltransferase TuaG